MPCMPMVKARVELSSIHKDYVYLRVLPCSTFAAVATALPHHLQSRRGLGGPKWRLAVNGNGFRVK